MAYRVIDGTLYKRTDTPYAHDIRVHQLGGHLEATVLPVYSWEEIGPLSPQASADWAIAQTHIWVDGGWVPAPPSDPDHLDKLARHREKSARRARTKVRRLCLDKLLDCMLTLTTRENITDRAVFMHHLDLFFKRLRRVIPDFQYVCVLERQKRGAWHAHIACRRVSSHYVHRGALVKSYDLLRALWRAVVGQDNGTCNVRKGRYVRKPSKLAAYIAKYIGKDLGEDLRKYENSYSASGSALPKPVVVRSLSADLEGARRDLARLIADEIASYLSESGELHTAYLDCGGYFLSLSP